MSAPPYMKLYIADYLGDTHHLNALEHGAYMLLLMGMWRAGGRLPATDESLHRIARCTPDEWAQIKPTVLAFFTRSGGRLTHKRLAKELAAYQRVVGVRSEAGKRSRSQKPSENSDQGSANADRLIDKSPHNQNQNQNQTEEPNGPSDAPAARTTTNHRRKDKLRDIADAIWEAQPVVDGCRRTGIADVYPPFLEAVRRGGDPEQILAAAKAYYGLKASTRKGGEFAKSAKTLLEEDRWREFIPVTAADPATVDPEALARAQRLQRSQDDPEFRVWWSRIVAWTRPHAEYWEREWGPRPDYPGCLLPDRFYDEFGIKRYEAKVIPLAEAS